MRMKRIKQDPASLRGLGFFMSGKPIQATKDIQQENLETDNINEEEKLRAKAKGVKHELDEKTVNVSAADNKANGQTEEIKKSAKSEADGLKTDLQRLTWNSREIKVNYIKCSELPDANPGFFSSGKPLEPDKHVDFTQGISKTVVFKQKVD